MQPVLITGFHRSGTSWVARALHESGMHLGDDLLADALGNPYGHFEDIGIIELHDTALAAQDLTWKSTRAPDRPVHNDLSSAISAIVSQRSALGRPSAIKDPRLCLFLPEWLAAAPRSQIVIVFRRPDEVVASLHRRHAQRWVQTRHVDDSDIAFWKQPDLALHLWVHYNEQLLAAISTVPRSQVIAVDWNDHEATSTLVETVSATFGLSLDSNQIPRDRTLGQGTPTRVEVRDPALLERAHMVWSALAELTRTN